MPLKHCDTESGVDGLSRSTMPREMKADFLTEVSRDLNKKVPQVFGGRPRSFIYSYCSYHGLGHPFSISDTYVSVRSPWSALERSFLSFSLGANGGSFREVVGPS